jgi:hypothetical protein
LPIQVTVISPGYDVSRGADASNLEETLGSGTTDSSLKENAMSLDHDVGAQGMDIDAKCLSMMLRCFT